MKLLVYLVLLRNTEEEKERNIYVTAQTAKEAMELADSYYKVRNKPIVSVSAKRAPKKGLSKNTWEYWTSVAYYERELEACRRKPDENEWKC